MNIAEYLQKTETRTGWVRPHVICKDGFRVSIQFGPGLYCNKYDDDLNYIPGVGTCINGRFNFKYKPEDYKTVELGYPSDVVNSWLCYAEDEDQPINTVYPYVPIELVQEGLDEHGGIDFEKSIHSFDRKEK